MQILLESVVVGDRVRKEVGELSSLMDSLRKHGQLSPVLLTRQNELIAGYRRVLAARQLGWRSVDAVYVDRNSPVEKLEMELEENVLRKDFSPEELLDGYQRLDRLRRPGFWTRLAGFFRGFLNRIFRRRRPDDAAKDRETPDDDYPDNTYGT